jgi:hypothetical protein
VRHIDEAHPLDHQQLDISRLLENEKAIVKLLVSPSVMPVCVMPVCVIPACVPAHAHARQCLPACTSTFMNYHDSIVDSRGCAAINNMGARDSIIGALGNVPADVRPPFLDSVVTQCLVGC